jgi:hypothetical protein
MIREQDCDGSRRHTNNGSGAEDNVGGCYSRSVVMIREQDCDGSRRHTNNGSGAEDKVGGCYSRVS